MRKIVISKINKDPKSSGKKESGEKPKLKSKKLKHKKVKKQEEENNSINMYSYEDSIEHDE